MRERRFNNAFSRLVSRNEWIQIPGAHWLQVKIKPEESSNSNPFDRIRSYSWYALRIKAITWRRIDELIREIIDRIPVTPDLPFHHIFLVSCFPFSKGAESKIYFILDKILNEFFLYNIYKLDSCRLFCKIVPKKQVASHIRGRILVKINGDFCDFIFSRNHTFAINI